MSSTEQKILKCVKNHKGNWVNYSLLARELNMSRLTIKKYILKIYHEGKLIKRSVNKRKNVWKLNDEQNSTSWQKENK